jgi:hypothetical protein
MFSVIVVFMLAIITIGAAAYFDLKNQTSQDGSMRLTSTSGTEACNGIKIKFKQPEVDESLVQQILKTVGAAEGDYNAKNGMLFIPLKDKCDRLSAIFAATSLRDIPEIDYATPVFLTP